MKKCYLITNYSPSEEKEQILSNLINSLRRFDEFAFIILVSHNLPTKHVIDKVNYLVFDPNNELVDLCPSNKNNSFIELHYFFNLGDLKIRTQYCTNSTWHGFAAASMIFQGLTIAKSLGFSICHQIEYDSNILDYSEIIENEKILENHRSVYYELGPDPNMIYCQFASYFLEKYEYSELDWSNAKREISRIVSSTEYSYNSGMFEIAYFKILHSIGSKGKSINHNSIEIDISHKLSLFHINYPMNCGPFMIGETVWFFTSKFLETNNTSQLLIIVNGQKVIRRNFLKSTSWEYFPIDVSFEELENIQVIHDGQLIKEYDFINQINKSDFKFRSVGEY